MDNFIFGLQAILVGVLETFRQIVSQELFLGFCIGFFVSTCVHLYVVNESPRHLPRMVLTNAKKSFSHVHAGKRPEDHPELFLQHEQDVHQAKFAFLLFSLVIVLFILIALFKF